MGARRAHVVACARAGHELGQVSVLVVHGPEVSAWTRCERCRAPIAPDPAPPLILRLLGREVAKKLAAGKRSEVPLVGVWAYDIERSELVLEDGRRVGMLAYHKAVIRG